MPLNLNINIFPLLVIILTTANGFIANFISPSINSITIDLLILINFTLLFYKHPDDLGFIKYHYFLIFTFFFYIAWCFLLVLLGVNPLIEKILGFRNSTIYLIFPLLVISLIREKNSSIKIFKYINFCGAFVSIFGITQYAFSSNLPRTFLAVGDDQLFGFFGSSLIRPTALLGNTIIYSGAVVISFVTSLSMYIGTKKNLYLLFSFISLLAAYASYSRSAIAGLVVCALLTALLYMENIYQSLKAIIPMIGFFSVLILLYSFFAPDSFGFILSRMLSQESTTESSDLVHLIEISTAVELAADNFLFGIGLGTQGQSGYSGLKVITDGFWWQLVLETGFVGALLYLLIVLYIFIRIYKSRFQLAAPERYILVAPMVLLIYFHTASFINSSILGRFNFFSLWLLCAIGLKFTTKSR